MPLLRGVGRVAAILGRHLLVVSVGTTAGVLALLVLLVVWRRSVVLLGLAAILGLAVVLLLLLLLRYKSALYLRGKYSGACSGSVKLRIS